ncbi:MULTISPECIES: hypothetical protein [Halobacterium]|uniref:hypothetical protein n=1 Tax=Halobacterium TaxID=2239 RepID=UPI001963D019|nr:MULTISPECIES: hypothetical protein [Halobacterium]MCF2239419.1 hypothetical protein [Halobacterium salinarum]QRY22228.1 hypothetical protein JT689_09385 [Halobacterium sp. GSL-19]WJK63602.1 hypothetical protein QSJ49_10395 [Halobacterium salinarum]
MGVYRRGYRIGIGFQNESYYRLAKCIKRLLVVTDILLTVIAVAVPIPSIVGVLLLILLGILITKLEKRSVTETVGVSDEVSAKVNQHESEQDLIDRNDRKYRNDDN